MLKKKVMQVVMAVAVVAEVEAVEDSVQAEVAEVEVVVDSVQVEVVEVAAAEDSVQVEVAEVSAIVVEVVEDLVREEVVDLAAAEVMVDIDVAVLAVVLSLVPVYRLTIRMILMHLMSVIPMILTIPIVTIIITRTTKEVIRNTYL